MSEHTPATFLAQALGKIRRWPSVFWRWEAAFRGVEFQGRADILGRPMISIVKGGRIIFGDRVRIFSSPRANPLGISQPCALRAMAPGSRIILGRNVGMSGVAICAATAIEIGEHTILGAGAMVFDNDFHQPAGEWEWNDDVTANARPIAIGRGVFIGARAIILKGVAIGDRAIVGAGAVVAKDVPARHVAVGNPARIFPLPLRETPRPS
ncbi:MAG: acyltransferase [Verrucomicrobiota bacterium]|nr:acyltransferase [Verrucomicrobiota bacterium]